MMAGHNKHETLSDIGNALSTEPKSIKDVVEETGRQRVTVSKYLRTLSNTGLLKEQKNGKEKRFWKPVMSDRQTGLQLRGVAYSLVNAQDNLDESRELIEELIEKSTDSERKEEGLQ